MVRYTLVLPLIFHGLAHLSGFLASWTTLDVGYTNKPWGFGSGHDLRSPAGRAFGLLWLIAMLGLVGSGLGLLFYQPWWPDLLTLAAFLSLAAILPWWNIVPPGAKIGAAFDALLLLILLTPWRAILIRIMV